MVLKISATTVAKYKNVPSDSKLLDPIRKKRKKLQTDDLKESVKQEMQLEVYKMYQESKLLHYFYS